MVKSGSPPLLAFTHSVRNPLSPTQDNGAMAGPLFGQTAGAATAAAAAVAMPRSRVAAQRWGDIASLAYVAEVEGAA